jgi:hypothetical protein
MTPGFELLAKFVAKKPRLEDTVVRHLRWLAFILSESFSSLMSQYSPQKCH